MTRNDESEKSIEGQKSVIAPTPNKSANDAKWLRYLPFGFFVIAFACAWALRANQQTAIANLILLTSSAIATLLVLSQRLPLQNVISITVVITLFSGASQLAGVFLKSKLFTTYLLGIFPGAPVWTNPLLWVVALVNARGIAQFVFYPLRKTSLYGLWLIGSASLIAVSFNGSRIVNSSQVWVQALTAGMVLTATVPWFIDKRRVEPRLEFQPIAIIAALLFW